MRCPGLAIVLLLSPGVAAVAQDAFTPPAVGQPPDFSRAVGMFRIEAAAAPTAVAVEEPIELTVTITGQAMVGHAPRQAHLRLFPADIDASFYVEAVSETAGMDVWRFVYRLRPKATDVTHVPGLRFTYYAPRQKRYQAAHSDAIAIQVTPRVEPKIEVNGLKIVAAPPSFLDWTEMPGEASSQFELSWVWAALLALGPPLLAGLGVYVWKRIHPQGAAARERRRNKAAVGAVAALTANHRPAPEVIAVVTEYLRARLDFAGAEPTPSEVERWLKRRGVRPELRQRWQRFFRECDERRYRPSGLADGWLPATEAAVLIQELENDPCVAGRQ